MKLENLILKMLKYKIALFVCVYLFSLVNVTAQKTIDSLKFELNKTIDKKEKLKTLDALTRAMIKNHDKDRITYIEAYISLAKELEEYDLMATKSRFLIQEYINSGKNKEAIDYVDYMLSFKEKFKKVKSKAHLLLKKGGIYFRLIAYEKAKLNYKKAATLFMESKDSLFAADAYFFYGQASRNTASFVEAVQNFEKAHALYIKKKDYGYAAQVGNELGILFADNNLKEEAIKKWKETIVISKKVTRSSPIVVLCTNIAKEYISKKKFSLAKKYLDSTKTFLTKLDKGMHKLRNSFYYRNTLLSYYLAKEEIILAKEQIDSLNTIEPKVGTAFFNSLTLLNRAKYAKKKGDYNKAKKIAEKYLDFTKGKEYTQNRMEAEKLIAEVSYDIGNIKKAHKYLKIYNITKDSLLKISGVNAYAYQQARFETVEKEKTIIEQKANIQQLKSEQEIAEAKKKIWIALFLLIIFIVLGVFYYTWQKAKQKQKLLSITIAKNEEELSNFTKQLLLKSKEKENLSKELEVLKAELGEQHTFQNLQELVNTKILTKEDWIHFKEKFGSVYPSFLVKLKKSSIPLTESEERLLTLEKLNLSNNDIGAILGIAQKSVIITRYRLRKKLNIPKEVDIINFVESV